VKSTTIGSHPERRAARARNAFLTLRGESDYQARLNEISLLAPSLWRGQPVYALLCNGTTGRGPHLVNVPEALLWSLIDLRAYRCPFHS
jgi:hypothetical protein